MGVNVKTIGGYVISEVKQAEYVNPIEFDLESRYDTQLGNTRKIIGIHPELSKAPKDMADRVARRFTAKEVMKSWEEHYNEIMSVQFPDNYFNFLTSRKRKEQNKILEKHKLDVHSQLAIFYKAYLDYGFLFSTYKFEKRPKEFENKKYPELYYLREDGTLDIIGTTDMSEAQLKAALKIRNIVIAKFLDKENQWHCFLHTVKGITGREIGNTPHIHYISSAFGTHLSREMVLKQLSKGKYGLPSMIHIPYDEKRMEEFPDVLK